MPIDSRISERKTTPTMARLKSTAIGIQEINKFLENDSDFDFELNVFHFLKEFGFKDCKHGGYYEDPITGKSREFDIRLCINDDKYYLLAAIECKNIREYFPIIVSCVRRSQEEAWHCIAEMGQPWSIQKNVVGKKSIYKPNDFVGKSISQVGLSPSNDLVSNNQEVYEKWSQSLSSLHGMVNPILDIPTGGIVMTIPLLVVPDGRLWRIKYKSDGGRTGDPEQIEDCPIYTGGYKIPFSQGKPFKISHVNIMTLTGLKNFCGRHLVDADSVRSLIEGDGY